MIDERKRLVVLVEDDPLLVDIYTTKFKESGFDVVVVQEGDKVLAVVEKKKPDVIVLDIVLPHADGWQVLSEIKSNAQLKNTKVVILSNLGQKNEVEKGLQLGAAKYLIKAHYTPTEVAKEIETLLR